MKKNILRMFRITTPNYVDTNGIVLLLAFVVIACIENNGWQILRLGDRVQYVCLLRLDAQETQNPTVRVRTAQDLNLPQSQPNFLYTIRLHAGYQSE